MRHANLFQRCLIVAVCLGLLSGARESDAQVWHSRAHEFRRTVDTGSMGERARLVQVELFLHDEAASSLVVYGRSGPVPSLVLQTGPGDFARIVFQPDRNQARHWIYSASEATEARTVGEPELPAGAGLLLETRAFVGCDLNDLRSVQEAFERATPIGRRLVDRVFHRTNPCVPGSGPFFSRYAGTLYIDRAGEYEFYTSSQDCSFLLVDDRIVASAPGRHGPSGRARFGGKIRLDKGEHRFEYWHAAAGTQATMVAAWKPPEATRPDVIPPSAFGAEGLANPLAVRLEHRTGKELPDFSVRHVAVVSLPDDSDRLVRVKFRFTGSPALLRAGTVRWEFGDGQTSDDAEPEHIYLHPGIYTVRLTVDPRNRAPLSVSSRVAIWPEPPDPGTPPDADTLEHYAAVVRNYDAAKLDAQALLVLARTLAYVEDWNALVDKATAGLGGSDAPVESAILFPLLDVAVPAARARLDQPEKALHLLRLAAKRAADRVDRARLLVLAADAAANDLGASAVARELIEPVAEFLDQLNVDDQKRYWRVQGDICAREGNQEGARAAYRKAMALEPRTTAAIARAGSYGRTIEGLLQEGQIEQAKLELLRWADEFPHCKLTGFWHLLKAELHLRAGQHHKALETVETAILVNPDSPYADRLLWLEAEAAEQLGNQERARQALRQLVEEYPGSPLVDAARKKLEALSP